MNDTFARAKPVPRRAVLRVTLTVLMILVVSLAPGLAHNRAAAESPDQGFLNFANQTNTTLWIAISYLDQENCGTDGWVSKGWFEVASGVVRGILRLDHNDSRHFYYYAYGMDGRTFSGSTTTYVDKDEKFFWCEPAAGSRPDLTTVEMKEFVIDSQYTTYTRRLGSDRYVSLEGSSDEDGCWISSGCSPGDFD